MQHKAQHKCNIKKFSEKTGILCDLRITYNAQDPKIIIFI